MIQSIANQEAIEWFIKNVNGTCKKLREQGNPKPQCLHTAPFGHHNMVKLAQKHQDVIAWLGELQGDPTFKIHSQLLDHCCYN